MSPVQSTLWGPISPPFSLLPHRTPCRSANMLRAIAAAKAAFRGSSRPGSHAGEGDGADGGAGAVEFSSPSIEQSSPSQNWWEEAGGH